VKSQKTPRSRIISCLRNLWLKSRERSNTLIRDKYTCQECGRKKTRTKGYEIKVEVHHLEKINWDRIVEYVYRHILVNPKGLETLCKECHKKITNECNAREKTSQ
jgi:5-methylcytosine-specific restriction endonuclease McrA